MAMSFDFFLFFSYFIFVPSLHKGIFGSEISFLKGFYEHICPFIVKLDLNMSFHMIYEILSHLTGSLGVLGWLKFLLVQCPLSNSKFQDLNYERLLVQPNSQMRSYVKAKEVNKEEKGWRLRKALALPLKWLHNVFTMFTSPTGLALSNESLKMLYFCTNLICEFLDDEGRTSHCI